MLEIIDTVGSWVLWLVAWFFAGAFIVRTHKAPERLDQPTLLTLAVIAGVSALFFIAARL